MLTSLSVTAVNIYVVNRAKCTGNLVNGKVSQQKKSGWLVLKMDCLD